MILRVLVSLALAVTPTPAAACAVCLDSAFGDRGFNAAFVALMLTPFAVAAAVGGVLVWLARGKGSSRSATASPGRSERRGVWGAMSGPPTSMKEGHRC